MERRYRLAGLDCANCGAKIERAVGELNAVLRASLALPTQTLSLTVEEPCDFAELDATVHKIASGIEDHVVALCLDADDFSVCEAAEQAARRARTTREMALTIAGAVLLLLGELAHRFGDAWHIPSIIASLAAFLMLGYPVLRAALRAVTRRDFDEQLLMALASAGAIALGAIVEAGEIMLFYRVGEWLQKRAVRRSRSHIASLMALCPDRAHVLIGGELCDLPAGAAVPGDVIEVRPGERVPLDGVIIEGQSDVDASALTGEPLPVAVAIGGEIAAGSVNLTGALRLQVLRPFGESAVSRIIALTQDAAEHKADAERAITRFARRYTPAVIVLAALIALIPGLITGDFRHWVYVGLVALMLSCPCALVLSAPLTFFTAIGAASRRGILFKGGQAVEAAASINILAFDKTGTLTVAQPRVTAVIPKNGWSEAQILRAAAIAEALSDHPAAKAIRAARADAPEGIDYREWPGEGVSCHFDGERYAAGNARLMARLGVKMPEREGASIHVAVGDAYAGSIALGDQIRPEAARAIGDLRTLGLSRCVILTGDAPDAAEAVRAELGLNAAYPSLTPEGKAEALHCLREGGKRIGFVGDGINDAPALAAADVGIAMGASGREAAIEAGDVVLRNDSLAGIADAVRIAKKTMCIFRQNIALALGIKAAVVLLGAFGVMTLSLALIADVGAALLCVLNAARAGRT